MQIQSLNLNSFVQNRNHVKKETSSTSSPSLNPTIVRSHKKDCVSFDQRFIFFPELLRIYVLTKMT